MSAEFQCVLVYPEKAYDRVLKDELWFCMREFGVAVKYVRLVWDMYESSMTVVRYTWSYRWLHPGLALSPFVFALVMDRLPDEVRQESPRMICDL